MTHQTHTSHPQAQAQPDSSQHSLQTEPAVAVVERPVPTPTPAQARTTYNTEIPPLLLMPQDTVAADTVVTDTATFSIIWTDSSDAPFPYKEVQMRESMFANNGHSRSETQPMAHSNHFTGGWIFACMLLLGTLISLYLNNQKFKINDIFRSLFDMRALDRVFRESNLSPRSLMPMTGIYLCAIALTALQVTRQMAYGGGMSEALVFVLLLAALLVYVLTKNAFIRLFGVLFGDPSAAMLYLSSNYLFHFVGGLTLTPMLLFVYYTPSSSDLPLKIALGMVAILFIVRMLRGMQLILTNSRSSKLYLFYYLCIFELLPILITAKVIIQ